MSQWFDWHRGYQIVLGDDGAEHRTPVTGERLSDIEPGFLPRTTQELESGVLPEAAGGIGPATTADQRLRETTAPSITDHFETEEGRLFDDSPSTSPHLTAASTNIVPPTPRDTDTNTPSVDTVQVQRVAELRSELQQLRGGIERVISGLRRLGDSAVPDPHSALLNTTSLNNHLDGLLESWHRISQSPAASMANHQNGGPLPPLFSSGSPDNRNSDHLRPPSNPSRLSPNFYGSPSTNHPRSYQVPPSYPSPLPPQELPANQFGGIPPYSPYSTPHYRRQQQEILRQRTQQASRHRTRDGHVDRMTRTFGSQDEINADDYTSPFTSLFQQNGAQQTTQPFQLQQMQNGASVPPLGQFTPPFAYAPASPAYTPGSNAYPNALQNHRDFFGTSATPPAIGGLHQGPSTSNRHNFDTNATSGPSFGFNSALSPLPSSTNRPASAGSTQLPDSRSPTSILRQHVAEMREDLRANGNAAAIARMERLTAHREQIRADLRNHRREEQPSVGLDTDPTRPPPREAHELVKDWSCMICFTQHAEVVITPCGTFSRVKLCLTAVPRV